MCCTRTATRTADATSLARRCTCGSGARQHSVCDSSSNNSSSIFWSIWCSCSCSWSGQSARHSSPFHCPNHTHADPPQKNTPTTNRSQYSTGRAVVLSTPESLPPDSPFAGRYCVRFTTCGSTAHVRPDRLLPVYQQQHVLAQWQQQESQQQQEQQQVQDQEQQQHQSEPKQQSQQQHDGDGGGLVLLVASTVDYRRLARSQVGAHTQVCRNRCAAVVVCSEWPTHIINVRCCSCLLLCCTHSCSMMVRHMLCC